jgi:hypothetical protein
LSPLYELQKNVSQHSYTGKGFGLQQVQLLENKPQDIDCSAGASHPTKQSEEDIITNGPTTRVMAVRRNKQKRLKKVGSSKDP